MGINVKAIARICTSLGRKTGILKTKGVVNVCKEIGNKLGNVAQKAEENIVTCNDVSKTLHEVFPKAKKITITDDFNYFTKFMKEVGDYPDNIIKSYYNGTIGLVLKNPKTKETILKLPPYSLNGDLAVNTAVHELEHALFRTNSLKSKFEQLYLDVIPKRKLNKILAKAPLLNQKNKDLQCNLLFMSKLGFDAVRGVLPHNTATSKGLAEFLGYSNPQKVQVKIRDIIRKNILPPNNDKSNLFLLKSLKVTLQDEARAYRVGGQVAKKYLGLHEGCTKSEMCAQLYDEAIQVLNKEINLQQKNKINKLFGKKVKSYHREEKIDFSHVESEEVFDLNISKK